MSNRVVHFEIQADDPERAAQFYRDIFGWTIEKWDSPDMEYWMVMTADKDSKEPGINGGLLRRPCPAPAPAQGTNCYVCTVQVDDFDSIATKIEAAGGKVALPKFSLAGMAWQGYFLDTEGNTFGLHQVMEQKA
jgi:predicted enzyme related to lactoylglutathione lyase